MTVKEFLENHPNATVSLETGGGDVTITSVQRNVLLSGRTGTSSFFRNRK